MKWLKVENSTLIYPPDFDEKTGTFNCKFNEEWLKNNGFIKYLDEDVEELEHTYNAAFYNSCQNFKEICSGISEYFGVSGFTGSNKEINQLYSSSLFSTSEGLRLVSALEDSKSSCAQEAENVGLETFGWWNKCWDFPKSDLVELGILPKPISEYTIEDIGTSIFIPYDDPTNDIRGPIEFEVVGVNHHTSQCVNSSIKNTITLMSKYTIKKFVVDAKEPNNSTNGHNRLFGNPRWAVSNVRQWLNSDDPLGKWWNENFAKSLGYNYDEPPTSATTYISSMIFYEVPGFLNGFDKNILEHFAKIENLTKESPTNNANADLTEDYVFLPSVNEMGFNVNYSFGNHLSYMFPDDESKIKRGKSVYYAVRDMAESNWVPHIIRGARRFKFT